MRIDVAGFSRSKSQRRIWRTGARVELKIGTPEYSDEKFGIYLKHCGRFDAGAAAGAEFRRMFYDYPCGALECVWRLEGRIVAVSHIDVAPRLISSMYCFFDPDFARLSPGSLAVLREIDLAREHNIPWYYLGYWIAANKSMAYKADYYPSQVFNGSRWVPFRNAAGDYLLDPLGLRAAPFLPMH